MYLTSLALLLAATTFATSSQICNNYAEFCDRSYGNITEICAHNSPFYASDNIASNQVYDTVTQLNDGIRMVEGQTHMLDGTLHLCHTYCELLDAGSLETWLGNITNWLSNNPDEVVSVLIANGDKSPVSDFVGPIQDSGLSKFVYTPSKVPMSVTDWPTLGEMISKDTRVVIFMDYGADQSQVPYILDQYSQLWQTPIDPTDDSFPCTVYSPSGLSTDQAKERMYLVNHNLNVNNTIAGLSFLTPDTANINRTNGVSGIGSLGLTSANCAGDWGRSPNFLAVDYYNDGSPQPGSVFEVAAQANGVTYSRSCCGQARPTSSGSTSSLPMTVSTSTTGASTGSSVGPTGAATCLKGCSLVSTIGIVAFVHYILS